MTMFLKLTEDLIISWDNGLTNSWVSTVASQQIKQLLQSKAKHQIKLAEKLQIPPIDPPLVFP